MIASAVEAELAVMLAQFTDLMIVSRLVVRSDFLPERRIQTGIGDVSVKVPKVTDRSGKWHRLQQRLAIPLPEAVCLAKEPALFQPAPSVD